MRLIVCGVLGRMGTATQEIVVEAKGISIVAGIDIVEKSVDFPLYKTINDCNKETDCVISFLPPTAYDENMTLLDYCEKKQFPIVICTTGLCEKVIGKINDVSKSIAVLHSANMSFGINLICEVLEKVSKSLFETGFDIEIVEKHHSGKLDSPSGTAIMLANTINTSLGGKMEIVLDRSREHKKRAQNEIGVFALRGGGICSEHSIMFASASEVVEVSHSALSRKVYADGAIKAAEFLLGKKPGMYAMKNLLGVN